MDFLTFVLLLVSVIGNIVFVCVGVCLYKLAPPTAVLLLRKRLGQMKDSMLALVCYDDGVAVVKAMQVKSEGCLVHDRHDGTSDTYYIAKPTEDTGDPAVDRANYERDKIILPSVSVDGMPMALCYSLDGIAANPTTLLALQLASHVKEAEPNSFVAAVKVPVPTSVVGKLKNKAAGGLRVKVLLPINPLDIHRSFGHYWDQSMLEATKQRNQNIGAAKSKKDGDKYFKLLLILGTVVGIAFAAMGVVVGRFI